MATIRDELAQLGVNCLKYQKARLTVITDIGFKKDLFNYNDEVEFMNDFLTTIQEDLLLKQFQELNLNIDNSLLRIGTRLKQEETTLLEFMIIVKVP